MIVMGSPRRYTIKTFQNNCPDSSLPSPVFFYIFVYFNFSSSSLVRPQDIQMALAMDSYATELLPVNSKGNNDDDAGTTQIAKPGVTVSFTKNP
jgi:hypothetical protein